MNSVMSTKAYRQGILACLGCSILWGILPLYWQSLRPISSDVIIYYRIFLVSLMCFLGSLKIYGLKGITKPLKDRNAVYKTIAAGLIITLNWSIYIWAVNADHVIQTSIGYYIEPLMVCLFGVIFFKEKLLGYKKIALIFACCGLTVILIHFHEIPGIALALSVSFAVYSAIKKTIRIPAILSLFYETVLLMPISLAVIIYLELNGRGAIGAGDPYKYILLMFCGLVTAVPLGLFAYGVQLIPLTTAGLMEYISPSMTLLIGIFYLREPFDMIQLISFIIIWIGLAFFTGGEIRYAKKEGTI